MTDTRLGGLAQKVGADFGLLGHDRVCFNFVLDKENPKFGKMLVKVGKEAVFGFGVDRGASDATIMVQIAEGLQDNLPELHETWGLALPECPRHAHPMYPQEIKDVAWWICPKDGRRIKLMGSSNENEPPRGSWKP
jgi:hypothetical protein